MTYTESFAPSNERQAWPALPINEWEDTRATLHLWTQIVGKIRLALAPHLNHWWQVPLYVSARGLSTSMMPYGTRGLTIDFDFLDHVLEIRTTSGAKQQVALAPRSVADFYEAVMAGLSAVEIPVKIWTQPVELEEVIPFDEDQEHASYDKVYVERFWQALIQIDRVFTQFRGSFIGKASPVHFFWGAFDLAVTRFSGRTAPPHPGGMPNVGDWVMREGYSHELSSAGFWPGGPGVDPIFYSYAYPEPEGFKEAAVRPDAAGYLAELGEFILPYEDVRQVEEPDETLMRFLQSTYAAAAELGEWDRAAPEQE